MVNHAMSAALLEGVDGRRPPSRKTSDVAWLTIASVARIVIPGRSRRSTRNVERPSARCAGSYGAVRARSSIRSECSAREVHALWPSMTQPSSVRCAVVAIRGVSEPASRSVTPKACSRRSPAASAGSQRAFWASSPWRSRVPIVYIWAWHALALPPAALTASRMTAACSRPRPLPPYCRDQHAEQALGGHRAHERVGVAVGLEPAPVRGRVLRADRGDARAQALLVGGVGGGRRPCAASSRFARAQSAR